MGAREAPGWFDLLVAHLIESQGEARHEDIEEVANRRRHSFVEHFLQAAFGEFKLVIAGCQLFQTLAVGAQGICRLDEACGGWLL